jgi:NADPH2:quinone reductase
VAGRVVETGADVDPAWKDKRVVARTGRQGAYADRVVVPEAALVAVPEGLAPEDAVALLHDGLTAMALLEAAAIKEGDRVLVLGAGGGMGVLLVQLATAAGGVVVAAARGRRKLELLRGLGARACVDYAEPGWEDRALEAAGGGRFAVVLDGVGGDLGGAAFALTEPGGHFSAHGAPSGDFADVSEADAAERGITLRGIGHLWFGPEEERRLTQAALDAAVAGAVRPVVGQTFTLDRAAEAHAAIEQRRVVGKTLLVTRPEAA